MKRHFLITALLLTAAHTFAMDENHLENYQDPKPIVIESVQDQHATFAKKITKRLNSVEKALETDALETTYNTRINLASAYGSFYEWLALFDRSNKEESKKFIRPLRKLFVHFKEILNNEEVSGTQDYPEPIRHTFALNLRIQKLADEYSN